MCGGVSMAVDETVEASHAAAGKSGVPAATYFTLVMLESILSKSPILLTGCLQT